MLYISKGFKTNKLTKIDTNDALEWLANYIPTIVDSFDVTDKKATDVAKNNIYYFISGEIKADKKGFFTRSDGNVLSKDLIVLDYDDLTMSGGNFLKYIHEKIGKYTYIAYETIRSRVGNVRFRLILEPERPYSKEENGPLIRQIAEIIGLPIDHSSITWSQLQGLPCAFDKNTKPIVNYGDYYPVKVYTDTDIEDKKEQVVLEKRQALSPRSTTLTIKNYIDREREYLYEYTNSLSCIMVLAKSVQTGEIALENAQKYARMIALNNKEWEQNNLKKLETEINNPQIRTNYSFMEKFSKSMKSDVKISTFDCTRELMSQYHFAVIGTNEDARLHVYVEVEGIYTSNINYIYRLIYPMEPQFTEAQVRDVYIRPILITFTG